MEWDKASSFFYPCTLCITYRTLPITRKLLAFIAFGHFFDMEKFGESNPDVKV